MSMIQAQGVETYGTRPIIAAPSVHVIGRPIIKKGGGPGGPPRPIISIPKLRGDALPYFLGP